MNRFGHALARYNLSLKTNDFKIPMEELELVFYELQSNRIGISCGKFCLTHSMLASVSALDKARESMCF